MWDGSPMSPSSPQRPQSRQRTKQPPKKRTKTFTGCWTCRSRKVKCDEGRPSCRTCLEKRLECSGYGARLQWLAPETLSSLDAHSPDAASDACLAVSRPLRREFPPEPPRTILPTNRIEKILQDLDGIGLDSDPETREPISALISNFGVFSFPQSLSSRPAIPQTLDLELSIASETFQSHTGEVGSINQSFELSQDSYLDSFVPAASFEDTAVAWDLCNLHHHVRPSLQVTNDDSAYTNIPSDVDEHGSVLFDHGTSYDVPNPWYDSVPGLGSPNTPLALLRKEDLVEGISPDQSWRMDYQDLVNSLQPHIVPRKERFLMDHYRHRVVNLFCVIDNRKSPWKTIHLPLVLQCVGEQSLGGTSSKIRNSLRYALCSVSAFYLSNEHKAANRKDEHKNWSEVAMQYRNDAIRLLSSAVESDLYGKHRPRYKEFLATMLSMVTINVMSGDTSTSCMHLNGAQQLIARMATLKSKFSRKAQALHRIYLYLRVVYEATAPRSKGRPSPRKSPMLDHDLMIGQADYIPELSSVSQPSHTGEASATATRISRSVSSKEQHTALNLSSYEHIYGIPQALLLMLKETVEVIDMVDECHEKGIVDLPNSLACVCDALESKILDWPLREELSSFQDAGSSVNARIVNHQTTAFYNGLVVYFTQNVRMLSHRYQRQYVSAILDSIEAIEKIKAETNTLAAPLFWPAFIGATEALEPALQDRFRQWYTGASSYGLAAVRTGILVLQEVWAEGSPSRRHGKATWRKIVERGNYALMLT